MCACVFVCACACVRVTVCIQVGVHRIACVCTTSQNTPSHAASMFVSRYCLTTYEVALEYLRSGDLNTTDSVNAVRVCTVLCTYSSLFQLAPVFYHNYCPVHYGISGVQAGTSSHSIPAVIPWGIAGPPRTMKVMRPVHPVTDETGPTASIRRCPISEVV